MIFDSILNRGLYQGGGGDLALALDELAALGADYERGGGAGFEAGKKIVLVEDERGPRVWYTLQEYRTKPAADCVLESHRSHVDIHFYLSGEDGVGVARSPLCPARGAYDPEKDFGLHEPPKDLAVLPLRGGEFLVCYPEDAHMCAVAAPGREAPVRKAICKIRL